MRLVYFSPVAWDSYEQRPHYFVRDFLAAGGASVVWINPYASRLPGWRDIYRSDWRDAPMRLPRPAALSVVDPGGLPIEPLPGGPGFNRRLFWARMLARLDAGAGAPADVIVGIGRPTALAMAALESVRAGHRFYDAMDDFPEFYRGRSRDATRRIEQAIAKRVDRIFASSTRLRDKFASAGERVTQLPNAYDMDLLPAFTGRRPEAPQLGFIGCLGGWFDWRVAVRLADAVSPMRVTLVGPLASRKPARMPANLALEPPCTQAEGVRRLASFSVGLIPFVSNALTAGIDPIKYYQYRGAGLPILATRFGEMASRDETDGVFFLDEAAGIERVVHAALAWTPAAADVARFRAAHTWAERFRSARVWERGRAGTARP